MPSVLEHFPKALQELFITEAQEISDELGFIERERDILPATFATIVVLTWIASPNATYEDIASALEVSVQALQQKLNELWKNASNNANPGFLCSPASRQFSPRIAPPPPCPTPSPTSSPAVAEPITPVLRP